MKLSAYLAEMGEKPESFADRVQVDRTTILRYISGDRIPVKAVMQRIWDATGGKVTANDFYPSSDAPSQSSGHASPEVA